MFRFVRAAAAVAAAATLLVGATVANADGRDFDLVNSSPVVLTHVYVSASDVNSWEEDVMGRDVLDVGDSVHITFSGGDGSDCLYDVKVLGQQGQEGYLYKVDLCTVTTVTFS